MAPILLETICTTTVAMRLNFPERLYSWQESPATAWRERDGSLWWRAHVMDSCYCGVSGTRCLANPLLAAGNLALACNADS